jgi:hypothetical protein
VRALSGIVRRARRLAVRSAERRCDHRLAVALDAILAASPEELRDVERLVDHMTDHS